jgi:hypothetical protein
MITNGFATSGVSGTRLIGNLLSWQSCRASLYPIALHHQPLVVHCIFRSACTSHWLRAPLSEETSFILDLRDE